MSEEDLVRLSMQLGYEVDEVGHVWRPPANQFGGVPPPPPSTPPPLNDVPTYPVSSTPGAWTGNHGTSYDNWVRTREPEPATGSMRAAPQRPTTVPSQSYSTPDNEPRYFRGQRAHLLPNQHPPTTGIWNPTRATYTPQIGTPATNVSTPSPYASVPPTPSPASSKHSDVQSQDTSQVHSYPYTNPARYSPTPSQTIRLPEPTRHTSTAALTQPPPPAPSHPSTPQSAPDTVAGGKRPHEVATDSEPEVVDPPRKKSLKTGSSKKRRAAASSQAVSQATDDDRTRQHWTPSETEDLLHDVFDDESPYFDDLEDAKVEDVAKRLAETPRWYGKRSSSAIKSKIEEFRRLYPVIKEYLGYTGGAGDVDEGDADLEPNSKEAIAKRIEAMKKDTRVSSYTNGLTASKVKMWLDGEWYEIIDKRYRGKATYERPNDYNTERSPSPFGGVRYASSSPEPELLSSSKGKSSKASGMSGSSKQKPGGSSSSKGVPEKPAKEKAKKGKDADGSFTKVLNGINGFMEVKMTAMKAAMIQEQEKALYSRAEAHYERCVKILDGTEPAAAALYGTPEGEEITANARRTVANWLSGRTQNEVSQAARREVEEQFQ